MSEIFHSADQVVIEFPIEFPATGPITSAAGATCVASAWPMAGGATVSAVTNTLSGNTCTSAWATGALAAGKWRVQLKMTISGQPRVVAEDTIIVLASNP